MPPELILVNPWIYDFAAYDLWSKPLGLLHLGSLLRQAGLKVHLIDCLDSPRPGQSGPARQLYGTGKFLRERALRPAPLKHIPRSYSRYGISPQQFVHRLELVADPAALLITSLMTYWYPGVQEVAKLFREVHPHAPVILGGTYARLCPEHASRQSGADHVLTGTGTEAMQAVLGILGMDGIPSSPLPLKRSYAALDLYPDLQYVPILTSTGCPFRCSYCASNLLYPIMERRDPWEVLNEILFWCQEHGVRDFAFYDDALLTGAETHSAVFLEEIARMDLSIRFHTPNALHVREIHPEMAGLLFRSRFRTIRLGLETADIGLHRRTGGKLSEGDFESAVANLRAAGFGRQDIGAYVLMGLPGQTTESVRDTVLLAHKAGATPFLAEYSPIPHTPLWQEALASSEYDLVSEPLFHNNSLLPCWDAERRSKVRELRDLVKRIRNS